MRGFEIWRRFNGNHYRYGVKAAESFGYDYPDERVVGVLDAPGTFFDRTARFGWMYDYRVVGFADNDETFNWSEWVH